MKTISSALFLFPLCFGFLACSTPEYRFVPTGLPPEKVDKPLGEAVYSEPAQDPNGSVRILSMGVVEVKPAKENKKITMLHVRMIVSNKNASPSWLVNTEDQTISFPNSTPAKPSYANANNANLPMVEVKPNELRIVDLYYALPENEKNAKEIPQFDFHWKILAGATLVAESTLFDRIQIPDVRYYPYDPYPYPVGWGPVWWSGGVVFHERY